MHTSCKHRWLFSSLPQHCRWGKEFWLVLGCDSSHGCWHSSRWKSLVGEQELSAYSNFDQSIGPSSLNKSWSKLDFKCCNVKPCSGPVTWSKLSAWGKSKREESRERKGPCKHRFRRWSDLMMIGSEQAKRMWCRHRFRRWLEVIWLNQNNRTKQRGCGAGTGWMIRGLAMMIWWFDKRSERRAKRGRARAGTGWIWSCKNWWWSAKELMTMMFFDQLE